MSRILVTGGCGFLGSHLAERLVQQGHAVFTLDRACANPTGITRIDYTADCRNLAALETAAYGCDFIYHLAATVGVQRVLADPAECMANNIDSFRAVLSLGIPGLLTSTSEVYGKNQEALSEDSALIYSSKSRWSYAASKLVCEWMAQQAGWKTVRLFNVVGPRQNSAYGAVLPNFVKQALAGEPLTVHGDGSQVRTFIDVRDCVAILDALRDKQFDVVNVGGETIRTMRQLAVEVQSALGPAARNIAYRPYAAAYADGFEECQRRVPDLGKLRGLLGHIPSRPLEQTILALADSLRSKEEGESLCPSGQMTA